MIERQGSQALYRAARPLERAMADVEFERAGALPVHLIEEVWDPWLIAYQNLPYLAHGMGVTLWEEDWTEATQREWTARQWEFKHYRGSVRGIRMALEINGYALQEWRSAPQGFFVAPGLDKADMDAWIRQMPQLRIKEARGVGVADPGEIFLTPEGEPGLGYIVPSSAAQPEGFLTEWDSYTLLERRAVIRYPDGREVSAQTTRRVTQRNTWETPQTIEQFVIPGLHTKSFIVGEDFVTPEMKSGEVAPAGITFLDVDDQASQFYTVQINRQYSHESSTLFLDMLTPGLDPVDPRFETYSDIGEGGPFFFVGADFVGIHGIETAADAFIGKDNEGAWMMGDRIYLLDPNVSVPMTAGVSFIGVDVLGIPDFTIELLVDLKQTEPLPATFVGEVFMGEAFAIPEDRKHVDRALRAVVAAKGSNDRALVSFEVLRPLEWRDAISEETKAGDHVRATL